MRGSKLNTEKEVCKFLRASRFCHIWTPGFSEIAKPLFKARVGSDKDPLEWRPEQEKAFKKIKRLLTSTPALGLTDVTQDFNLFIHEKNHTALGGPHTNNWAMAAPSLITIQTTGSNGHEIAMPLGTSCHCGFGQRRREAYSRTKFKCKGSPCCYCPNEQPGA